MTLWLARTMLGPMQQREFVKNASDLNSTGILMEQNASSDGC